MKKLRARYCFFAPFSTFKYDKDGKKIFGGIVKDIYESMKTFIDEFDYEAEYQPNGEFGVKLPNGSFTGMLGSAVNNETDIAGPFQINEDRYNAAVFTIPLSASPNALVSGMVETQKHPFLIFGIFSLPVWMALLASITFISAATTVVYHVLPSTEKRSLPTVFAKYFWAYQTSLLDENFGSSDRWYTRHLCDSPSFRLLQLTWFVGPGLVLLYSYQGGIISAFSANKIKPKIASIEDLLEDESVGVISYLNAYPQSFFESLKHTRYSSIWERMKDNLLKFDVPGAVPQWAESVIEGKAVFTADYKYLMNVVGNSVSKTGECGIRVTPYDLGATYIGLAFTKKYKNSSILKQFNRGYGLRRFVEGNLDHFSLLYSNRYYDLCTGESTAVAKPLNLSDLIGAFIVLTSGLAVSTIVFFAELLANKTSKKKAQK